MNQLNQQEFLLKLCQIYEAHEEAEAVNSAHYQGQIMLTLELIYNSMRNRINELTARPGTK